MKAWLLSLLLLLAPLSSQAHKPSDAYWTLHVDGDRVTQRLDIALRDLDRELTLDANDDGQISWGEVRTRWPQISAVAQAGAQLQAEGTACRVARSGPPQLDEHSDGHYAVLTQTWQCDAPVTALTLHYSLFAASDPTHRGIARIEHGANTRTAVLGPDTPTLRYDVGGAAPHSLTGFVIEGMHHILVGIDHLLFLLALLLPAVLLRRSTAPAGPAVRTLPPAIASFRFAGGGAPAIRLAAGGSALTADSVPQRHAVIAAWQPASDWRAVLLDVLRVVSAFTLAHSITLALAVFDVVNPPSRWVESIIAASVVFAALNNLRPLVLEQRWLVTFGFGLVHGFGFASALKDLGLAQGSLAWPLLGFNLGVELGQLAVVALFVPLAWGVRHTPAYQRWALRGGSMLIALVALVWLAERAFDLRLMP